MLRSALLAASRSAQVRTVVEKFPPTHAIVERFVAGEALDDAVTACDDLVATGRKVTLDHLGEDTRDAAQAAGTAEAYEHLLEALKETGLAAGAEVSVKLSAVGQFLPVDGEKIALENARRICEAAADAGTTVTLDMEDHTTTDSTLAIARELRQDFPGWASCSRPTCAAPRPTAASSPAPAPGCACARAPTRSPSRSPSRASSRSTWRTSARSRS